MKSVRRVRFDDKLTFLRYFEAFLGMPGKGYGYPVPHLRRSTAFNTHPGLCPGLNDFALRAWLLPVRVRQEGRLMVNRTGLRPG
jgi:hypothetical protein